MKKSITLVHIDDDAVFLAYFKTLIDAHPLFVHCGAFTDVEAAFGYLQLNRPDIIFLDVEMPGQNGFQLAERLAPLSPKIVFLTSHTNYAMQAFEACALDYMTKPVAPENLESFAQRYLRKTATDQRIETEQIKEIGDNYLGKESTPTRIFINTVGKILIVHLHEVIYLASKDSYTEVFLADGTKLTSGKGIKTYEDAIVRNKDFIRIHRSFLVNKNYVKSITRDSRKHRYTVVMSNKDELEISFLKKDEIIQQLKS